MEFIGAFFVLIGLFFFVTSVVGIWRLPDAYSRLHASGKAGTLGLLGILVGAAFIMPAVTLKVLILGVFMIFSGPVVSHAIALARYRTHGGI